MKELCGTETEEETTTDSTPEYYVRSFEDGCGGCLLESERRTENA